MPDDDTWPPKPALPDPLTEYDDVIAAKLAALAETKTGPNKIHLIKALRDEAGIDLRQAYAAVNNYCERHDALARTRTSRMLAWLGCLPPLVVLCCGGFLFYGMKRRDEILSQSHHHAALMELGRQQISVASIIMIAAVLSVIISVISRRKK